MARKTRTAKAADPMAMAGARSRRINILLERLNRQIAHAVAEGGLGNWGAVGDLGRIEEALADLVVEE